MSETTQTGREWTFVLLNKNTSLAAWWLKLKSLDELADYLTLTNGRYARALQNYLTDSQYRPDVVGHGHHVAEAPLTLAAYLRGVNRNSSVVQALLDLESETAWTMAENLVRTGHIYINSVGGWNCLRVRPEPCDVVHSRHLVWPSFTESDIHISRFPGGRHWYARVGNVDVRNGDTLRFDTRERARAAATSYLTRPN